ncbi:DUF3017 domain-containing protein [Streptomyces sp. JNUCC 64]
MSADAPRATGNPAGDGPAGPTGPVRPAGTPGDAPVTEPSAGQGQGQSQGQSQGDGQDRDRSQGEGQDDVRDQKRVQAQAQAQGPDPLPGRTVTKVRNRRFSFTRDTARPEGGGRAASGGAPAPARQWPVLVVLGTAGVGLLLTGLDVVRAGTLLVGCALLGAALLRWALPSVGMLAVRSRFTDLITYGVLGGAIVLLSLMIQPRPRLVVPFLDDVLHYTVSP